MEEIINPMQLPEEIQLEIDQIEEHIDQDHDMETLWESEEKDE